MKAREITSRLVASLGCALIMLGAVLCPVSDVFAEDYTTEGCEGCGGCEPEAPLGECDGAACESLQGCSTFCSCYIQDCDCIRPAPGT